jgi:hypothetical protein
VLSALAAVVSRRKALVFVDHHHENESRGAGEDLVAEFESRTAKSA